MPVQVLTNDGPTNLRAWAIVGMATDGCVSHVALAACAQSKVSNGDKVPVYHMGPPLTTIAQTSDQVAEDEQNGTGDEDSDLTSHDASKVNFVAWLEDLTFEESRVMRRWHRHVSAFFPSVTLQKPSYRPGSELSISRFLQNSQYIAHPPYREDRDPVSGNLRAIWFSCTGFVIRCYENAAVRELLVDWNSGGFPKLTAEEIKAIWFPRWIKWTAEIAAALNLTGEGPWPVTVPGYVINAFWREDALVRQDAYLPSSASVGIVPHD